MNTKISRRFFIGGAASFGAFGGCRFFACHDFRTGGVPNLKFGVISDIHILASSGDKGYHGDTTTFIHTLEWFRDQGVDAVMIAGDIADKGMVEELQATAAAWYKVFPNDMAPDGRKVEKIFVYGNHDWEGFNYGDFAKKLYPDEKERNRHILRADYGKWWEEIFNEPYAPIYSKEVKGYTFIGQHWQDYGWGSRCTFDRIQPFLDKIRNKIDPSLPFFYTQHPHPKDTCYGSWAWGHDTGAVTKALSAFPNAVAFSGHSHYSLTDERSIWQGAFTSVGTSSLRYTGLPYDNRPPAGYENSNCEGKDAWKYNAAKMMSELSKIDCRQGMLWSVYDDCMVVKRREFMSDLDLGTDWVCPLTTAESKPFSFVEHAKKTSAPEFPPAAKLTIQRLKAKNRQGRSRDGKEFIPGVLRDAVKVIVPAVVANVSAREYELEFVAEAKDGTKKTKYVMAEGYNHALEHKKAKTPSFCVFALDELPGGPVRVTVTPINCFRKRGKPLTIDC